MIEKLPLDSIRWKEYGDNVNVLIQDFLETPSANSEPFMRLTDAIWDSGTCKKPFYSAIPHIIEVASTQPFEIARDIWIFLGSWISSQEFFRSVIEQDILTWFDLSLGYAEKNCMQAIIEQNEIPLKHAAYLYACLFAFAKHGFGYMTMSDYGDDLEGTSIAKCRNDHLNDYTIYNSGIVAYEEDENPHNVPSVSPELYKYRFQRRRDNPWMHFYDKIDNYLNSKEFDSEVQSHIEMAKLVTLNGITPDIPMKFAFSVYGALILCDGYVNEAMRYFHGWDIVECTVCGDKFNFSDAWCEKETTYCQS